RRRPSYLRTFIPSAQRRQTFRPSRTPSYSVPTRVTAGSRNPRSAVRRSARRVWEGECRGGEVPGGRHTDMAKGLRQGALARKVSTYVRRRRPSYLHTIIPSYFRTPPPSPRGSPPGVAGPRPYFAPTSVAASSRRPTVSRAPFRQAGLP